MRSQPTWWNLPRPLLVLFAARSVNRLGGFSMAFLGVHLIADLHADLTTVGVVLALFGLATIPSRLAGGALSDSLGSTPTIAIGLVACAASQLVIAAAPTVSWAAVGATLLGLSYEIIEPPSQALVASLSEPEHLPSAYALLWASLAVAGVAAGLVAAVVTATVGIPWLFVVDAGTSLACAGLVVMALRVPRDVASPEGMPLGLVPDATPGGRVAPLLTAARDRRLLRHTAVGTLFASAYMIVVFALPLTVEARALPTSATGVILAVEALVALAVQPLVVPMRRWTGSQRATIRLGHLIMAGSVAGAAVAGTVWGLALALAGVAVGTTLVLGHLQAAAAELAPAWAQAAYLAVFGLSWGVATTIAPVVTTTLLGVANSLPWLVAAGLALGLATIATSTPTASSAGSRVSDG